MNRNFIMDDSSDSYSNWTLRLRSRVENSKFWKYRCDDVQEQFGYMTVIICLLFLRWPI